MLETLDGMLMEVKLFVFENAYSPMLVTVDGMVIEPKPVPLNVYSLIIVTLDGMVIELKEIEAVNAFRPILVN